MHAKKLLNYLKMYRKRSGLTQIELAFLSECRDKSAIYLYEKSQRFPKIRILLAYEAIFGISTGQLFAGIFEEVQDETKERAKLLLEQLRKQSPDRAIERKMEFLRTIITDNRVS